MVFFGFFLSILAHSELCISYCLSLSFSSLQGDEIDDDVFDVNENSNGSSGRTSSLQSPLPALNNQQKAGFTVGQMGKSQCCFQDMLLNYDDQLHESLFPSYADELEI